MAAEPAEVLNGTYSGSFTGAPFLMEQDGIAGAIINITNGTAITHLSMFFQGSDKLSGPWADVIADHAVVTSALYTEGAERINKRNIVNDKTNTTPETYQGIVKHFPYRWSRLKGVLVGTDVTLSAIQFGK